MIAPINNTTFLNVHIPNVVLQVLAALPIVYATSDRWVLGSVHRPVF
jgi:hypothetical protein